MVNLFKQNQLKKLHEAKKEPLEKKDLKKNHEYNALMAKLQADQRALKGIRSRDKVLEYRQQEITHYLSYIDGVIENGQGGADPILSHMIIWLVDTFDVDRMIQLGQYMLEKDVPLPANFNRPIDEFIIEQVADNREQYSFEALQKIEKTFINEQTDIKEIPEAKFYRALGESIESEFVDDALTDELLGQMIKYWEQAMDLNENVGIKGKLNSAIKERDERQTKETKEQQSKSDAK